MGPVGFSVTQCVYMSGTGVTGCGASAPQMGKINEALQTRVCFWDGCWPLLIMAKQ